MSMDNGCPKCEEIEGLCIDCQLEQADADVVRAMRIREELEKKKANEITEVSQKEIYVKYATHEPLCPECGRRAFPTNFPPECFGGKKDDKRIVWFCSDMGHCAFSVDSSTKWQLKKKKEQENADRLVKQSSRAESA